MFPVKPSSTSTLRGGLATYNTAPESAKLSLLSASSSLFAETLIKYAAQPRTFSIHFGKTSPSATGMASEETESGDRVSESCWIRTPLPRSTIDERSTDTL